MSCILPSTSVRKKTRIRGRNLSPAGESAYAEVFSERDGVWAWSLIFGAASLALGFLVAAGCIGWCTYRPAPPQADPSKAGKKRQSNPEKSIV